MSHAPSGWRWRGLARGLQRLKSPTRLTYWACGALQMKFTPRTLTCCPGRLWCIQFVAGSAKQVIQERNGGMTDLRGLRFELPVLLAPPGFALVTFTPHRAENALGALDLLEGGGETLAALGEVGNVTHKEPADALLILHGVQEDHHRLLVGIPAAVQHFAEELVTDREELGARALGGFADLARPVRGPGVKQRKGAGGVDQGLGVRVAGGALADAHVLFQLDPNLGEVVQAADDFAPDGAAIIEVARDQPVNVAGLPALVSHAQSRIPHLAGIDTPRVENVGRARDGIVAKIREALVAGFTVGSLAIDHRDRPRVAATV